MKSSIGFYNVDNHHRKSFICFDVCNFYPSISEELLNRAITFASYYDNITDEEKDIIIQTKKSMLFNKQTPWCKHDNQNFDVIMGSFDGAESCELVGLYMLSQLEHLDINVGLYRDDGLTKCNKTPRQIELIKKEICSIFTRNDLKITIDANKATVDFLDITLNLTNRTYKPFMKPGNTPLYVHSQSNHPPPYSKTSLKASTRDFLTSLPTRRSLKRHHRHTRKLYKRADTTINWNMNLKTNKGITTESAQEMLRDLIYHTVKMWPPTLAEGFPPSWQKLPTRT